MPDADLSRGPTGRVTTEIETPMPDANAELSKADTGRVTATLTAYDAGEP